MRGMGSIEIWHKKKAMISSKIKENFFSLLAEVGEEVEYIKTIFQFKYSIKR